MEMVINSEKISRFSRCALRPTLGSFLRDINSKIWGISQCRAICTTLENLTYSVTPWFTQWTIPGLLHQTRRKNPLVHKGFNNFCAFQLVDGHTLFDYGVGLNDLIQLMVRAPVVVSPKKGETCVGSGDEGSDKENKEVTI